MKKLIITTYAGTNNDLMNFNMLVPAGTKAGDIITIGTNKFFALTDAPSATDIANGAQAQGHALNTSTVTALNKTFSVRPNPSYPTVGTANVALLAGLANGAAVFFNNTTGALAAAAGGGFIQIGEAVNGKEILTF